MLKIHNLVVNYGAINALRGISLDVREGEVVRAGESVLGLLREAAGDKA